MTYHTMKRYRGNGFIVACILQLNTSRRWVSGQLHGLAVTKSPRYPSGRRLDGAVVNSPGEESIYPSSKSNSDSSVVQLVT
jgi:hypothetical protein